MSQSDRPILVVDDDLAILSTISDILSFEGYAVETASNGVEALQVIERVRPALILLDMRMPVLDGWQFAAELAQRGLQIPIVVMTAAQDTYGWANEVAAAGYLEKPFDVPELLDVVKQLYHTQ